jgi:hypothetical protein
MIFQYTYNDLGNKNYLKKIKYSIIHLNSSKSNNDKIHFDYMRTISSNPKYELQTFKLLENNIINKITISNFNNQYCINSGYPITSRNKFLELAINEQEDSCHINPDLIFNENISIDTNSFWFLEADSVWWNVPWGFLKIEDAYEFLEYCKSNNIIDLTFEECFMYRDSFFFCPKQYLTEFFNKSQLMTNWIVNKYKNDYSFKASCTCATQIVSSFIALYFKKIYNTNITMIVDTENKYKVRRYPSESESDVAGAARIFF